MRAARAIQSLLETLVRLWSIKRARIVVKEPENLKLALGQTRHSLNESTARRLGRGARTALTEIIQV